MKAENGKFYFIKDDFFEVFKGYKLMENKENDNKRPFNILDSVLKLKPPIFLWI